MRSRWRLGLAALALVALWLLWPRSRATPAGNSAAAASDARDEERAVPPAHTMDGATAQAAAARARLALRGRVVDSARRPVAGAEVTLVGAPPGEPLGHVRADAGGEFVFTERAAGRYLLEAAAGDSVTPTVPVALASAADYATLVVFAAATLDVTVVAAGDERPVAGALVRVGAGDRDFGGSDAYREAHTGADGVARVRGVAPGANHPVYAEADGYLGAMINLIAGRQPDPSRWSARVTLQAGPARIVGRVLDAEHRPLAGAKVGWGIFDDLREMSSLVDPIPSPSLEGARFTDANGEFTLPAHPGVGCVMALLPGYRLGTRCNVHAVARKEVRGVDLVLDSGAALAGRVVDVHGRPVGGATVLVTRAGWNHMPMFGHAYRYTATSGPDGAFRFGGLDPMPLAVYAYSDGASSELVPVDLSVAQPTNVRVTLEHDGRITGVLLEEDWRTPVAFATVRFFAAPTFALDAHDKPVIPATFTMTRSIGAVLSDENGRFAITSLPPGEYSVHANRAGGAPVPPSYASVWKYHVKAGDELTMVLPGSGAVRGRVVYDDDGSPVRSFGVSFAAWTRRYDADSFAPAHLVASADGHFDIGELPARRYGLEINGAGLVPARVGDVTVGSGDSVDVGTIRVGRAVARRGIVVSADDGTPIAGAVVLVGLAGLDGAGGLPRKLATDDKGRFEVASLDATQSFRLRAEAGAGSSGWVTVAPGDAPIELDVRDAATGAVSGVVVDPAHAAQHRLVVLTLAEPGVPGLSLRIEASATTDTGGRFRMDDVRSGDYVAWVRGAGPGLSWARGRTVTVAAQGEATVVVAAGGAQ